MATTAQKTELLTLLVGMFDAAPTAAIYAELEAAIDAGATVASIGSILAGSTYFAEVYPSTEDFTANFATNLLGSNVTEDVLSVANTFVAEQIANGASVADVIVLALTALNAVDSADETWGAAATALKNKVEVATYFAENSADVTGYSTLAEMKTVVASVTNDSATVTSAKSSIDAVVNVGSTFTLTTATDDIFVGTSGNDTFTGFGGTSATFQSTDMIVDASTADADVLTLTGLTADVANTFTSTNVETVNINSAIVGGTTFTVAADKISGTTDLNITRDDLLSGQISGKGAVTVTGLNGEKITNVDIVGTKAGTVTFTQATKAGSTVTADTTGQVDVTGAATVNVATATTVNVNGLNNATEDAKATVVNAAAATTVNLNQANKLTGEITVNAAKVTDFDASVAGGATLNIAEGVTSGTTVAIDVVAIDDSGVTITTGTNGSMSSTGTITRNTTINLSGTDKSTDTASIVAGGYLTLDAGAVANAVDALTLSGNGSALDVALSLTAGSITSITKAGDDAVTVRADSDVVDGKTVTGLNTLILNGAGAATIDLDKVSTETSIVLSADIGQTIVAASGAAFTIDTAQTDIQINSKTDKGSVTVNIADSNTTDGVTPTVSLGAVTLGATGATFSTSTINTSDAKVSMTSLSAGTANAVTLTGTKDVTITGAYSTTTNSAVASTTVAKSIDASALTGKLTINVGAGVATVTSGSAADVIVVDGRSTATAGANTNFTGTTSTVYTINAGDGDNTLTLTSFGAGSQFISGAGADTVTVSEATSAVISTGAGDDTVTIADGLDSDIVVAMGEGSSDKLVFANASNVDLSNNTNFAYSGVETVDVTAGGVQISANQFANDNIFKLVGDSVTADKLTVKATGTTGSIIDASGITFDSTQSATLVLVGGAYADTITGSAKNDTITGSAGADVINGGDGTDTYTVTTALTGAAAVETNGGTQTGIVVNLSASAVTAATIATATSTVTADSITSVAAGTTAYLYSSAASTNSAVQQTLASIENVTGSAGKDYIVGSTAANVLIGGDSADTIIGGEGTDTISSGKGADKVVLTETSAAVDTVVFGNEGTTTSGTDIAFGSLGGADTITGFGSTDVLTFDISAFGLAGSTEYVGALTSLAVDSSEEIVIITGTTYASDEAAEDAIAGRVTTDGLDMVFVYFNSTDSTAHIVHDTDAGVDGTGTTTLIGTIDLNAAGVNALTTANIDSFA